MGQKLLGGHFKPRVRAFFFEYLCDAVDRFAVADNFTAIAVEYGNRQTPVSLTGDTPVGSLLYHGNNALATPFRHPLNVLAGFDSFVAEFADRAEPLRSRTENDGIAAAPAVRIAVRENLGGKQRAAFLHILHDFRVGYIISHTGVGTGFFCLISLVVNGDEDGQMISHTGDIVVRTESGSCMDTARTAVHCDIFGSDKQTVVVKERMTCGHALKCAARECFEDFDLFNAARLERLIAECCRNNISVAVACADKAVFIPRMNRNGKVARQCPGGGRPNYEICVCRVAEKAVDVIYCELDID